MTIITILCSALSAMCVLSAQLWAALAEQRRREQCIIRSLRKVLSELEMVALKLELAEDEIRRKNCGDV